MLKRLVFLTLAGVLELREYSALALKTLAEQQHFQQLRREDVQRQVSSSLSLPFPANGTFLAVCSWWPIRRRERESEGSLPNPEEPRGEEGPRRREPVGRGRREEGGKTMAQLRRPGCTEKQNWNRVSMQVAVVFSQFQTCLGTRQLRSQASRRAWT